MAKMTRTMKEDRKAMMAEFVAMGGEILSNPGAGVTVVAAPAVACEDPNFVQVAVSQCDFKDDTFKRKYGEWVALTRWFDGVTMSIPTHGYRDADEIASEVLELFE